MCTFYVLILIVDRVVVYFVTFSVFVLSLSRLVACEDIPRSGCSLPVHLFAGPAGQILRLKVHFDFTLMYLQHKAVRMTPCDQNEKARTRLETIHPSLTEPK